MYRKPITTVLALAAVSVIAAVIAQTAGAATPSYIYNPGLRWWVHQSLEQSTEAFPGQTKMIPQPVEVRCYSDAYSFDQGAYQRGDDPREILGLVAYYAGGNTIHVRAGTCSRAADFVSGHVTELTAGAFATILHEAIHRQGIHNENLTEEMALIAMYSAGRLVDLNQAIKNGQPDNYAIWQATVSHGTRAMILAWADHEKWVAPGYRIGFPTLKRDFTRLNWSQFIGE
jgi:hypothetical protein